MVAIISGTNFTEAGFGKRVWRRWCSKDSRLPEVLSPGYPEGGQTCQGWKCRVCFWHSTCTMCQLEGKTLPSGADTCIPLGTSLISWAPNNTGPSTTLKTGTPSASNSLSQTPSFCDFNGTAKMAPIRVSSTPIWGGDTPNVWATCQIHQWANRQAKPPNSYAPWRIL